MIRLSANLGFLWTELTLVDAIHAAANAGFDAVECHWPFSTDADAVREALYQTQIPMISLNTSAGDLQKDDFGLCALPDRKQQAQAAIKQAVDYAASIGAPNVHVMSGKAAHLDGAHETFVENLEYAVELAAIHGISILIEPINRNDVPDYYLADFGSALQLVNQLQSQYLKILFDCYHIQKIHGEIIPLLEKNLHRIGHIQIAAVPSRHEPDEGDIDYKEVIQWLDKHGYQNYIGAEYKPRTTTDKGLGWLEEFKSLKKH